MILKWKLQGIKLRMENSGRNEINLKNTQNTINKNNFKKNTDDMNFRKRKVRLGL